VRRRGLAQPRSVDIVGAAIDVAEHRSSAAVEHRVCRRDPGERRHNHFVAGPDIQAQEREIATPSCSLSSPARIAPGGARRRRARRLRLRALRQPAGFQRLAQCLPFFLAHGGLCDLNASGHFGVRGIEPFRLRRALGGRSGPSLRDFLLMGTAPGDQALQASSSGMPAAKPISSLASFGEPIRLRTNVA